MRQARTNTQRFGFVICAKDESSVIVKTIHSVQLAMKEQDDLFVIADNCADETAQVAAAVNAKVFVRRQTKTSGKGAALKWFVLNHWPEIYHFKYLIIIDADSLISPTFSDDLEIQLLPEILAAQCLITPIHYSGSPLGSLIALSGIVEQTIFDGIRQYFGWSVRLYGTGMVFSPSILREICVSIDTEVEDIALSLLLAAKRVRVYGIRSAVVFDPKPTEIAPAARQRARWFRGQWSALRIYRKIIWNILTGDLNGISVILSLFLKPRWLKLIFMLVLAISFLHFPVIAGILFSLVILETSLILVGIMLSDHRSLFFKALFHLPEFVFMWLKGIFLSFQRLPWLRARNQSPMIESKVTSKDQV